MKLGLNKKGHLIHATLAEAAAHYEHQGTLAHIAGIKPGYLSQYLGLHIFPKQDDREKLANALFPEKPLQEAVEELFPETLREFIHERNNPDREPLEDMLRRKLDVARYSRAKPSYVPSPDVDLIRREEEDSLSEKLRSIFENLPPKAQTVAFFHGRLRFPVKMTKEVLGYTTDQGVYNQLANIRKKIAEMCA